MDCAIRGRGICKTYGTIKGRLVLDNLDITVKKGTIYGLLGASGCGKTTLLSAIVGSRKPDSGHIKVLGQRPGGSLYRQIGYMPQDVALIGEFSVRGAINHFGWLFGIPDKIIGERFEFLHKLLDLPPSDRRIKDLSGGQQRRVSLAAVLIHKPQVLILDEPTVGIDPVLRQKIWDYLLLLVETEKTTIIITTHYIEEAKQAHCIGLMRNGKLLAEGKPQDLLLKYSCPTVEDVFLLLSRKQFEGEENISQLTVEPRKNSQPDLVSEYGDSTPILEKIRSCVNFTNRHHTKALVTKNLQKFFFNKGTLVFCYIFPLIQMSIFFVSVGKDPTNLKVGVVNPEMRPYSTCKDFAQNVHIGGFRGPDSYSCNYTGLACKYLMGIPADKLTPVYFENSEQAKKAVQTGQVTAYIDFHQNFTAKTWKMRENLAITAKELEEIQINIYMDKSSYPISKFVERTLLEQYNEFTQVLEGECGYNMRASASPIKKFPPVYSSYDAQFLEFIAPGCMLTVSIFLAISVSSLSIVTERTEGTWDRTIVAGVSTTEIVIFHFLTMALVNALQNVVLFIVTFGFFGLECRGSLGTVWFLLTCQGIMGTAFGTLISVLSKTVSDCMIISLGMFYPVMVLSGVCWPLEGMPPILRQFSYYCIPSTMSVEAMANIINRGWSILSLHVAKGFLSSALWCALFNGINIILLKREER